MDHSSQQGRPYSFLSSFIFDSALQKFCFWRILSQSYTTFILSTISPFAKRLQPLRYRQISQLRCSRRSTSFFNSSLILFLNSSMASQKQGATSNNLPLLYRRVKIMKTQSSLQLRFENAWGTFSPITFLQQSCNFFVSLLWETLSLIFFLAFALVLVPVLICIFVMDYCSVLSQFCIAYSVSIAFSFSAESELSQVKLVLVLVTY